MSATSLNETSQRVLLVDDTDAALLALALRRAPFTVDTAESAAEGLALYEEARRSGCAYDLLVLDGSMSQMDGFTMAKQIRDGGDRSTKIVFLTAHTSVTTRPHAQYVGAVDVWEKPGAMSDLETRIKRVLSMESNG